MLGKTHLVVENLSATCFEIEKLKVWAPSLNPKPYEALNPKP